MLGNQIPGDGGTWLRYDAFGPPLAAYAASLTSGPITVLWRGSVDVPHLQKFFADAARAVSSKEEVRYRTRILTRTDRDVVEAADAPPLGRLAPSARFVRFECIPAASAEESYPFLVAWANLDEEPPENPQESIGVYFRREDMPVILPQIEPLVRDTASRAPGLPPLRSEQTRDALHALQQDLT